MFLERVFKNSRVYEFFEAETLCTVLHILCLRMLQRYVYFHQPSKQKNNRVLPPFNWKKNNRVLPPFNRFGVFPLYTPSYPSIWRKWHILYSECSLKLIKSIPEYRINVAIALLSNMHSNHTVVPSLLCPLRVLFIIPGVLVSFHNLAAPVVCPYHIRNKFIVIETLSLYSKR